jgi:hypothetical protein
VVVKALQKSRLNRIAHKIYYNYVHGFATSSPGLLNALERSFDKAVELGVTGGGDYYEFRLFKGYSFWYAQKTANDAALADMRFFGFDSFAGLPEVHGVDIGANDDFYAGQYACSKDRVIQNLNSKSIDWQRTTLIEGYFEKSLANGLAKRHGMRHVAVALIDCDLYASTRSVLNFLGDMLVDGSVILMDDWNCFDAADDKGQRRALAEFKRNHPGWTFEDFFPTARGDMC